MKLRKAVICIALVVLGAILAVCPQRYSAVCLEGLCLWAECVLPSLFPFMVITSLLAGLGAINAAAKPLKGVCKKLRLSPAALPLFITSAVSGYPAGSRTLCEYYKSGHISRTELVKLAPLCSVCGPVFALGTVGYKAFGGGSAGIKLLSACLISVISTSLIYCLAAKGDTEKPLPVKPKKEENPIGSAFYGGTVACLTAGAYICFFYTLSKVIADCKIFMPLECLLYPIFGDCASGLCLGLCEATGGCFAVANAGGFFSLPLAGFMITFGGASILMQQLFYLSPCGVKPLRFVLIKFVQGILCFAILCLFSVF